MALTDDVITRWSTSRLRQLTNPDDPTASTYNAARLAAAAADVGGEFRLWAGVNYDSTKTEHVAYGIQGVEIYLRKYQGHDVKNEISEWHDSLERMMNQIAWIAPTTNSGLQPSTDAEEKGPGRALPDWDDSKFSRYKPRLGTGGSGSSGIDNR